MTYSIVLPNGTVIENIPDHIPRSEAEARIIKRFPEFAREMQQQQRSYFEEEAPIPKPEPEGGFKAAIGSIATTSTTNTAAQQSQGSISSSSVEQKPLHLKNTDLGAAASYGAIQTVAGMAVAVAVFWLLTRKLWKKPRETPHKLGYWLACWVGCLQLGLSIGKFTGAVLYGTVSDNDVYLLLMNGIVVAIVFGLCAYAAGWLFRRFLKPAMSPSLSPAPLQPSNPPLTVQPVVSNAHFAQALAEIDSGLQDKGLWARCYAEADGDDAKAKAAYLKHRASELANHA